MSTRGYVAHEASAPLVPFEFSRRALGPRDVAFDVLFSGICHSDIHQVREEWGPSTFPMVPGHEIIGVVTSVGADVTKFAPGQRIGVGVFVDSCRTCDFCVRGLQQYCRVGMTPTYNGLDAQGEPLFGGYANQFVIDQDYAVTVSEDCDLAGAAPLLCAGITLYSPLKHFGAGPGKRVGIIGLGGLGHMGVQFAHALGAHVTVFTHSASKEADARALGADDVVVTHAPDAVASSGGHFDLIINASSADLDINPYLRALTTDGVFCFVGISGHPFSFDPSLLIGGRRHITGSAIGGMVELQEMMDFAAAHGIASQVEVIEASAINEAYERTVASDVKYRFVIDATTF